MMGLDDGILSHPKFRRAVVLAGSEAIHLWLGLRAYCSQQLTDGHVPTDMLRFVDGPEKPRARTQALQALREVGLVHDAAERANCPDCKSAPYEPSGLWLHHYLLRSESRDRALQRRVNNRDRQRQLRGLSQRDNTGDEPDTTRHQAKPSQAKPSQAKPDPPTPGVLVPAVLDPCMNPEETIIPLNLRERATEPGGAVDQMTEHCKVKRAIILAVLEDYLAFWSIGAGSGKKRPRWLAHFRQRVLELHRENRLPAPGAVEHERDAQKPRQRVLRPKSVPEALDPTETLAALDVARKAMGG